MKIKEIEERSGMSRANIRFYESEGLIAPARDTNGYRDYSEADLEILQRIKLLRTLRISLEEIKAVANGQHDLVEALDAHLLTLETEKLQVEQAQKLCRLMRDDNVQYASLDAQYYLEYL
ncbi:MAG: MerR family transcriptional regulator [Peptococcaceae bacterium]|nr:MerR family transcriptional regulator [Peptococcaceae bacterium]